MLNRRKLITGLISFVAAPAIVRANSLMQVKVMNSFDPQKAFHAFILDYEVGSRDVVFSPIRLYWLSPEGLKIMPVEQSDLYLESLNDLS